MRPTIVLSLGFAAGCLSASAPQEMMREEAPPPPASAPMAMDPSPMEADGLSDDRGLGGLGAKGMGSSNLAMAGGEAAAKPAVAAARKTKDADPGDVSADKEKEAEPARTRSWFPEAFLWQPLVETGEDGVAIVDVRVPDQLTTWRVLGLAHDRSGQQAGAVHTFAGTLPVYVDPVVPGWLYAGDRVLLPVQAVNTTGKSIDAQLELRADGAMSGLGRASVTLSPGGSDVRTIPLAVVGAGEARLSARLTAGAESDAAERVVRVLPAGRPVETSRGGMLAEQRTFALAGPEGADPSTEEIEVLVFPGPLAVLQAELDRIRTGARPEDGAYGFAVSTIVSDLSRSAGIEPDEAALRRLRVLAWQRVVVQARSPSPGQAADLLLSMGDGKGHEQAEELTKRLVQTVTQGQRADGTWSRLGNTTLQGVLVDTALTAYALPSSESAAKIRAQGAVERYAHEVKDPFTASVLLACGLVPESHRADFQKLASSAIKSSDIETTLTVPADVIDAWGVAPSRAQALAWAVLALPEGAVERGDLASLLMQGWDARYGFGAGRADTIALRAVAAALPGTSAPVTVTLRAGDGAVVRAMLDPSQPKAPAVLSLRPGTAAGSLTLRVEPAVPGLAFVATRRSWVPWSDSDRVPGVELQSSTEGLLRVGSEGTLRLVASAPSGVSLRIEQGLPAGASLGEDAVARATSVGARLETFTDRVVVTTRAFRAGEVFTLDLPVTPAFAGRFQTVPTMIAAQGRTPVPTRPLVWDIGG